MKGIRQSKSDRIFTVINNILLGIVFVIILYPLIYIVSCSFSDGGAVVAGRVWLWPVKPTLKAYRTIFEYKPVWTGYANSIFYTFFGTLINVVLTVLVAYPLSRKDCYGRNVIMFLITFTMIFNAGLIPTYILIEKLGMVNTRWAMLLPNAIAAWNVIITRTYFQTTISDELLEAAQLDGCSDMRFLISVVMPLSGAIIAVISLFYAVGHWNAYFNALIYLRDKKLMPLQMFLRDILILNEVDMSMMSQEELEFRQNLRELLKYALIIVASVPVLIMYPFVQKYFVKGVMVGAIKG